LSLVFHRYHKAGETKIQRSERKNENWVIGEQKISIKKILGFDVNALYLWCLGEEEACGELKFTQSDDVNTVLADEFFGFAEVDIHVPEHLYNYFSELPPITKNCEFT
jgi:hypothetical protein